MYAFPKYIFLPGQIIHVHLWSLSIRTNCFTNVIDNLLIDVLSFHSTASFLQAYRQRRRDLVEIEHFVLSPMNLHGPSLHECTNIGESCRSCGNLNCWKYAFRTRTSRPLRFSMEITRFLHSLLSEAYEAQRSSLKWCMHRLPCIVQP